MSAEASAGKVAAGGAVLAIDGCGPVTSLCLGRYAEDGLMVVRELSLAARTAGEQLTSGLAEVLAGLAPRALRAIVVVRGPGSFTGMRISLSAAKALAEAADVPMVAVSRLAILLAAHAGAVGLLDAGRGQVYLREEASGQEWMLSADAVGARLQAALLCEDRLQAVFPGARRVNEPRAADALHYARARVVAADWDDVAGLDALYLWRAEQMFAGASPMP